MKFTESPVNGRPGRGISNSSPEPVAPLLHPLEPSDQLHPEPSKGPTKRVNLDFEEKRALIASSLSQEKRVLIANSLSEYLGTLPGAAEYTPSTLVQTNSLDSSIKFLNNGIPELSGIRNFNTFIVFVEIHRLFYISTRKLLQEETCKSG